MQMSSKSLERNQIVRVVKSDKNCYIIIRSEIVWPGDLYENKFFRVDHSAADSHSIKRLWSNRNTATRLNTNTHPRGYRYSYGLRYP